MHLDELIHIRAQETIHLSLRRHWVTYVSTVILYTFLALLPIVLYFVLQSTIDELLTEPYLKTLLTLLMSVYELSVALFFYSSFLIYYLDMLIITSERLVEVKQLNLFSRSVSELDLSKIEDATSDVHGLIPTIFNYGKMLVQTAGEKEQFSFEGLPSPHEVRRKLMLLTEENQKREGGAS